MRTEQIDFGSYYKTNSTRYIYNSGADVVRASDRNGEWFIWENGKAFITTVDVDEYSDNPAGLRAYDAGHLVLNPTSPTGSNKVVFHMQSNTTRPVDTSGNRVTINLGSNNTSTINGTLNHPASGVSNILSFSPPKTTDGVFRNLVGQSTRSEVISGDDKDFVITGFYNEKHRQQMLDYLNSLTAGPSGRTFYFNDREIQLKHIMSVDETVINISFSQGDVITLEQIGSNQQIISLNLADISIIPEASSDEQYTLDVLSNGQDVMLIDDVNVTIEPTYDSSNTTDYDVWTNTNNELSAANSYNVTTDQYNTDVLPLLSSLLISLP